MSSTLPDIRNTALTAWDAGLAVIPILSDGSKSPPVKWKHYQGDRPSREQVERWFTGPHAYEAVAVICGGASGGLCMIEMEGDFYDEGYWAKFKAAAVEAVGEKRWAEITAYVELSPSGGPHIYVRCDGFRDGNEKLAKAMRPNKKTGVVEPTDIMETRGQGGYSVIAGSVGHESGEPWVVAKGGSIAEIATVTREELDAILDCARTLDELPEIEIPEPTPRAPSQHNGDSWMDATIDAFNARNPVLSIIGDGWEAGKADTWAGQAVTRVHRKGSTNAFGATIFESGRIGFFSSNAPTGCRYYDGRSKLPTYDAFTLDLLRAGKRDTPDNRVAHAIEKRKQGYGPAWNEPTPKLATPPENVDATTGEIVEQGDHPNVDLGGNEEFWNANETLAHIRQAARARRVSPTAALGAVLARVAAFTPPSRRIPPFVGGAVPLSLYVALVAGTSGGKSTVASVATELLPTTPAGVVGPLPLGSGEGVADAYLESITEKVDGKNVTSKKQTRMGALFTLDEGRALADMAKRSGTTIVSALCTAWTGGDLGQANASAETFRHVKAGGYACGVVSLWQPTLMGGLFDETDSGLAGRMLYLPTVDADAPDHAPDWPGTLDWEPPTHVAFGGELRYAPEIRAEVDADHLARIRGELVPHPLDGHRNLHRLKIAGLLAVLDGRSDVTTDDWTLATTIIESSDAQRAQVKAVLDWELSQQRQARIRHDVERATAIEASAEQRALEAGARAMARRVHRADEKLTLRDLNRSVAGRDRKLVSVDEMVAHAVAKGWIAVEESGDGEAYLPGESRPT